MNINYIERFIKAMENEDCTVKRNHGDKSILVTSDCGGHHCLVHNNLIRKYRKNPSHLANQVIYKLRYMRRC